MSTYFIPILAHYMSQYNSVSKMRGYILDDLPARAGIFTLPACWDCSGAHSALCPLGMWGSYPGGKIAPEDVYSSVSRAKDKTALIETFTSVSSHIHDVTLSMWATLLYLLSTISFPS